MAIEYVSASVNDISGIINILKRNNLPHSDISEHSGIDFFVARNNNEIVGCIGIEKYGNEGLLRSLVVDETYRSKGVALQLYHLLKDSAQQSSVKNLHLFTTTAEEYFMKKGFRRADRNEAPEAIQTTTEFTSLCPCSCTYMVLENIEKNKL